jgi:hypothetical protein
MILKLYYLQYPGADGRILLKWFFKKSFCMEWIEIQDRDQCQALLETTVKLWVPYKALRFLTILATGSFSRKICWMDNVLQTFRVVGYLSGTEYRDESIDFLNKFKDLKNL